MYSLSSQFNGGTLPAALLQRYASADGPALKTALYLLQHGSADEAQLCCALGFSETVAARCIAFWVAAGLITEGAAPNAPNAETAETAPPQQPKPLALAKHRLYHSEMAAAALGDPAMAALLQETQRLLGKQLSVSESRLLFEIVAEQNLSPAVILTLVSYWSATVPQKKVLTETLHSAKEWNTLDIRTVDAAEMQVQLMETRRSRQGKVAELLGKQSDDLTRAERRRIDEWFESFGYDEAFVSEVLLRKADAGIPYIHTVFKDWRKKGYKTVSDTRVAPINAQPQLTAPTSSSSLFQRAVAKNTRKENE
ncbi:MAG: DnaD domain protein [Oscillospiraceae bacterium]|nr:DnaD domain protein [Oscillospiraceae bacterium]